jgi:aspartyl-tRNA(Asn)/glutamyl-tRNA(Gln) amidotransferase subunit A
MYLSDVFTATANLAGICALAVPSYPTPEGLPIGLQILGPAFGEGQVLHIGHAFEKSRLRQGR